MLEFDHCFLVMKSGFCHEIIIIRSVFLPRILLVARPF